MFKHFTNILILTFYFLNHRALYTLINQVNNKERKIIIITIYTYDKHKLFNNKDERFGL